MHIIQLKIHDKVYEKLIWLLGKFSKDEVEVISNDAEFLENKKYLEAELEEIKNGKANFLDMHEVELRLENIIKKRENNL